MSLTAAMNRVNAIAQEKAKQVLDSDKKSFHEKENDRYMADPANKAYQAAIQKGEAIAKAFLSSALDPNAKDHEKCFAEYKNKYGRDSHTARATILKETCDEMNASEYEKKDPAYESRVFVKYKPAQDADPEAHHFYEAMKTGLEEKWRNRGYRSDATWVKEYADKYGLKADENLESNRNFKLKS